MTQPLVSIQNLTTGYNQQKVLDNVSVEIFQRDFIGIIGPNGGGKSTLIKAILGLIPIWEGDIKIHITPSKIGYLPQFNPFDNKFPITVKEVVLSGLAGQKGFFSKYKKEDIERAVELIQRAGATEIMNKSIGQLSGGQMQRVLLCRALINSPELLILDEPSTFVDNQFEHELFMWLSDLNKNMAILMVSHDIGTISSQVKTIACINRGLHYHKSSKITAEQLAHYNCPIQIITHGEVPHQVLATHKH